MDPPLAKKQKINPKKPITFKSASMKPDIYFEVFGQEFHVTSMVLKLRSGFFRTFLDPAGGKLPKSTQPGFASEWFTRIDDDGAWELSSDHQFRTITLSEFKGSKDHEELCFQKLLCAIHGRAYQLENADELVTMTDMARYYQVRPVVSPTVCAATFKTPNFYTTIMNDPCSVLTSAKTLRNDLLFKDSLLLCLGPWSEPAFLKLSDPELRKTAAAAHARICAKVAKVQPELLLVNIKYQPTGQTKEAKQSYQDPARVLADVAYSCRGIRQLSKDGCWHDVLLLPIYYRRCSEVGSQSRDWTTAIREAVAPLLTSDLRMASNVLAGVGQFKDYFLCLDFDDSDLPWGPAQYE